MNLSNTPLIPAPMEVCGGGSEREIERERERERERAKGKKEETDGSE
jgi:hypothetical protein